MIVEETLTKLRAMKFYGMADAFEQQCAQPETASLSFEDRFGLLVDHEWIYRENRKLSYRLGRAKLRIPEACVEKIDYQVPRKLNKSLLLRLTNTDWVEKLQNVIITGPTGSGKSFLACALANAISCRSRGSRQYRAEWPSRQAFCAKAQARKLFPLPVGPVMITF